MGAQHGEMVGDILGVGGADADIDQGDAALAVVAAGSWLYSSGRVDAWLGGPSQEERVPTEAELDALERETREQEAALARADTESGAKEEVTPPTPKPQALPAWTSAPRPSRRWWR